MSGNKNNNPNNKTTDSNKGTYIPINPEGLQVNI